MAHPSTLGEWDIEIADQTTANLEAYRDAMVTLRAWEAFNGAFKWTRVFVLEQSIRYELDRRFERERKEAKR